MHLALPQHDENREKDAGNTLAHDSGGRRDVQGTLREGRDFIGKRVLDRVILIYQKQGHTHNRFGLFPTSRLSLG